ncbi:hypothetical protein FXO37_34680 [Capsicum annuum]|nr:hypothetical protein FXO37_34680 [Capsicum annuum]
MRELQTQVHDLQWELSAMRFRMLREIRRLRTALLIPVEDCEEAVEGSVRNEPEEVEIEPRIDEEVLILPHCLFWLRDTIKMVDNLGFFERYPRGKESFALTLDYLKKRTDFSRQKKTVETKEVSSHVFYRFPWAFMIWIYEAFPAFGIGNGKSTEESLPIPRLLRWHTSKGDKLVKRMVRMGNGDDDWDLGRNFVSRHVTRGVRTSKPRASGKTPMIENLKERLFRMEHSIKDIIDFVKEERMRRAEKEKQKKRDEAEAARAFRDDSSIKEALLEVAALEQASINADEVMIPEVVGVVEKKNLNEEKEKKKMKKMFMKKKTKLMDEEENKADGSAGVENEDLDEGRQDEDDKNEKNSCEKKNNEGDGEKIEEKNAQEVEKEEGEEEHKEERKNDAPEKKDIVEKENENEFPNWMNVLMKLLRISTRCKWKTKILNV